MNVSTDPATIRAVISEIDRTETRYQAAKTALEREQHARKEAAARMSAILTALGQKSIIVDDRRWNVTRGGVATSTPVHVIPPAPEADPCPPTPPSPPQAKARSRATSRKRTRSSKPD